MKILRKKDYDDLINQIKYAEDKVRDQKKYYENKQLYLEKEIEDLKAEKKKFNSTEEELTRKLKNLEDIVVSKNLKIEEMNEKIDSVSQKKKIYASRIGGLQKQNNKLKDEIKDKTQKIENLKEGFRKTHKKLTINQYDKRLKGINKKEN